jgi:hypothetical protein
MNYCPLLVNSGTPTGLTVGKRAAVVPKVTYAAKGRLAELGALRVGRLSQRAKRTILTALRSASGLYSASVAMEARTVLPYRRIRVVIERSGLFDPRHYLAQCGGDPDAAREPLSHYLKTGEAQGLQPNALFDPAWYRANNMDQQAITSSALAHYVLIGTRARLSPGPHFDAAAYLTMNPDIASSGAEPLRHFLRHGAIEGRRGAGGVPANAGWFGVAEQHDLGTGGVGLLLGERHSTTVFEEFRLGCARARPATLHLLHKAGGGTERAVSERVATAPKGDRHLVLMAGRTTDGISLSLLAFDPRTLRFETQLVGEHAIASFLEPLGIGRVVVHQPLEVMDELAGLLVTLGVPYDVVMHDYSLLCPRSSFVTTGGRYCGEPDVAGCRACLRARPIARTVGIEQWRRRGIDILEGAEVVECALHDVALRVRRYAPGARTVIVPMPDAGHREVHRSPKGSRGPFKVAVIGHCSTSKGGDFLLECIEAAHALNAPISWRLIGSFAGADLARARRLRRHVGTTGAYAPERLEELLAEADPDLLFFPQHCVETWSYALSEAIASRKMILAVNLGAFGERLRGVSGAYLYSEGETAGAIVRRVLELMAIEAIAEDDKPWPNGRHSVAIKAPPNPGREAI